MTILEEISCPCGSGLTLTDCCGRFLSGREQAATAEQLMRSRYTAFVLCDTTYLARTWHPDTRPENIDAGDVKWLGLQVKQVNAGGIGDDTGSVVFVARYKVDGRGHRLHEVSQFSRLDGRWFYLHGDFRE